MADRERENPVGPPPDDARGGSARHEDLQSQTFHQTSAAAGGACAECGCPQLTLISDGEIVSLYKCPKCGHLAAPVKRN
jgi:uncharacterized Zn finger protein (UPF0148 family)